MFSKHSYKSRKKSVKRSVNINSENTFNASIYNPPYYFSYFFRKDIIEDFQHKIIQNIPEEKLMEHPLSTYKLYNKDKLLNMAEISKNIEKKTNPLDSIINYLSKHICSDIGENYSKNAIKNALETKEFDILFMARNIKDNDSLKLKLDGICGFIIVELGECKLYKNAYSINLICTNKRMNIAGTGSILMGAYLYTILSHPETLNDTPIEIPSNPGTCSYQMDGEELIFKTDDALTNLEHVAVLELANAYINAGGLCMYEKFGFKFDNDMYRLKPSNNNTRPETNNKGMHGIENESNIEKTKKQKINKKRKNTKKVISKNSLSKRKSQIGCFYDIHNLPMKIDFNEHPYYVGSADKRQLIINIVLGMRTTIQKSKICLIRDENRQKILGYLKFIEIQLSNGYAIDQIIRDYDLYYGDQEHSIDMKNIINFLLKQLNKNQQIVLVLQLIEYIENAVEINDDFEKKINELVQIINKQPPTEQVIPEVRTTRSRIQRELTQSQFQEVEKKDKKRSMSHR